MKPGETSAAQAVLAHANTPLWLVTARAGARTGGLIATFVSSASIVPELPRVVLGLAQRNHTHGLVCESRAFALHHLNEAQLEWVWRFGLESGRDTDKLADLVTESGPTGSPILAETPAWLDCRVEATLDTGDRTLFVAEVLAARDRGLGPPLTRGRLLALVPEATRTRMKALLDADATADAEAIRRWRAERRG
jgi:flavin reductase (DIM6/NTAB) family NADH-FMN oxidoreductase RutF